MLRKEKGEKEKKHRGKQNARQSIYTATLPGKLQAIKSSLTSNSPISLARFICSRSRSLLPVVGARLTRLPTLLVLARSSSRSGVSRPSSRRIRTPFLNPLLRLPPPVTVETLLSLEPLRVRR